MQPPMQPPMHPPMRPYAPVQVGQAACAYAAETVAVVEAALADAFHEVNVEGCACVEALVGE
jgi:hypothetical protein